jgi:hypothetical protein
MLSSNYRIKGVDINPNAIALNLEKMKTMAAKRLLHFECSDVSSYFKKQQMTDALLVVSVATLKFFTADQLLECLKTMKARSEKISLAICEEMPVRTLRQGHSLYTGNLGFAHDYPTYFTQAGYQLKHVETRSLDGAKSDYQLGYILATAL